MAHIKTHVYQFSTSLAQNAVVSRYLLTSEYRILPPFCMTPVPATYPRTNALSVTVTVSTPSALTPQCASLVLSVSAEWCSRCCQLEAQHNESVSSAFVCVLSGSFEVAAINDACRFQRLVREREGVRGHNNLEVIVSDVTAKS